MTEYVAMSYSNPIGMACRTAANFAYLRHVARQPKTHLRSSRRYMSCMNQYRLIMNCATPPSSYGPQAFVSYPPSLFTPAKGASMTDVHTLYPLCRTSTTPSSLIHHTADSAADTEDFQHLPAPGPAAVAGQTGSETVPDPVLAVQRAKTVPRSLLWPDGP